MKIRIPIASSTCSLALVGLCAALALVLVACARDETTGAASSSTTTAEGPVGAVGLTGELIRTRQRDLLDRGLINVRVSNDSEDEVLILDRRVDADYFAANAAEQRISRIGPGRRATSRCPTGRQLIAKAPNRARHV